MPSPTTTPACPECAKPLQRVRYEGGYLNRDQWESVRAGDWYCEDCRGTRSKSGYRYFWDSELVAPVPPSAPPAPAPGELDLDELERLARDAMDDESTPATVAFLKAITPERVAQLVAVARRAVELEQARVIALHEAVAPLYFADSSDYQAGLYNVVKVLDAALWRRMEDGVTRKHYKATCAAADAARASRPTEETDGGQQQEHLG